ncbi:MAG: eCIS core domain-containing protein [Chlorobaculum sp.]
MKSSADKSSASSAIKTAHATAKPFFSPAAGRSTFFAPAVQMKMEVSKPGDPLEKEADHMAGKVMRMASPTPAPAPPGDEKLQKQGDDKLQKSSDEKLQKEEKDVVQKAEARDKKIQKAEDDKLQKAPEADDKLQKKDEDKLQKSSDEQLQKEEKKVVQKAEVPEKEIQKAEDDKLQKASEADDKLQKQDGDKLQKKDEDKLQAASASDDRLQRKEAGGAGAASSNVQSAINGKMSGGQPMSSEVRGFMEPRFNADFSNVRIHSDPEAASLNNQLSARAFTHRNHIFFSRDQYQPGTSGGKHLLAHELTHTIQQGHAVQRAPQVSTTSTPPPVQRLGIQDALDYFADKAANIPGFTMLTVIIGFNPINHRSVDRSAANILRAMVEMVPGGHMISQALDNHGIFNRVGTWAEQQFATLGDIGSDIVSGLRRFIDSLSWTDIFDLGGVWDRAKSIFTSPIRRLISFATSLVSQILGFIREAILRPLAALAEGTRGYDLLKALLGQNPITGEAVPRTADTLIGGFMKLIGQEEIWENIKKGNAVARAWAWFQGTLEGLLGFARSIPQKIIQTLSSLTITDLVTVVGAFRKIGSEFLGIAAEFGSWALGQVISLLEILFSVVAPGVMPYLKKAQAAFTTILKNPIGFVGNLVRAAKLGFQRFAGNIVTHLKTALIKWLVGPLADAGVYIPKSFSLMEIIKLVLSVLGLTWQNIRAKLVKIIPEPVLAGLEKTAGILVTLVKEGPAAAWQQIKTELNELKGQLIAQVTQMVSVEIVKAAVMKLVSMINPAGAVVQAIIAIYNTVTFFIEKINQIAAVVGSFINSIAAIAAGQVDAAAGKVEQTLANTLTLVISFLAKFAGIGGIPAKLVGIVRKIRQPIDKGLDKIVAWLGKMLKKMVGAVTGAIRGKDTRTPEQKQRDLDRAVRELRPKVADYIKKGPSSIRLRLKLQAWKREYRLTSLNLQGNQIVATINPSANMYTAEQKRIGQALEPILVQAEQRYLKEVMGQAATARRLAKARRAMRSGQALPEPLTQDEMAILIREARSNRLPLTNVVTPPRGKEHQVLTTANVQGFDSRITVKDNQAHEFSGMQNLYVTSPGRHSGPSYYPPFPGSIEAEAREGRFSAETRGLRDQIEPARSPGQLATNRVGSSLVSSGLATEHDITSAGRYPGTSGQPMAGMATWGSAETADADFFGGKGGSKDARAVRQGAAAEIFGRLRQAINSEEPIIQGAEGNALRQLGTAFDNWCKQTLNGENLDTAKARNAANQLAQALTRFLRATRPKN